MKRLYPIIVSLLFAIPCMAYDFSAPDVNGNTIYYNILGGDSLEVTYESEESESANKYSGNIMIPEMVNHESSVYRVTAIGSSAFYGCNGLTSVTIGEEVSIIRDDAFYGCSGLTSVHITDIAKWCEIEFVSYSSNPLVFAHHLYVKGSEVTNLVIPDGVDSIRNNAFTNCENLTSLTIPESVTSIGRYAFYGCSGLTSVTIPEGVISIGEGAFGECSGLISVTIPESVTSIGRYAFFECSGLTFVTIPESVTSIGSSVFYNCYGITSITIPESVSSIGSEAFYNCFRITSVTIPESVMSIGSSAFCGCIGLTSVNITDLVGWCEIEFENNYSNPLYHAKHLYLNGTEVTDLVIPEGVESVGNYAFYNCSSLTSVTIPESVTSIGSSAFYGCTGLTSVTIPESVTSIGSSAFYGCTGLSSVTIHDGVISIGNNAFYNVSNIVYHGSATGSPWGAKCVNGYTEGYLLYKDETKTKLLSCSSAAAGEIAIPNSVTSIADNAFYNCGSITSITIPSGVTSIGRNAFYGCKGLTSVHIMDLAKWCEIRFINYNSNPLYYAKHLYLNGTEVTNLVIPDGVESVGNYAFFRCTSITSVTIPNSVTTIGEETFYSCSGLTSVVIPGSVTSIGGDAFYYCVNLAYVRITDLAKWCEIRFVNSYSNPLNNARSLYVNGSKISNLVIPVGVDSIGSYAFYGCTGLTSVTIPEGVISIGRSAFDGCKKVSSVTIPESVTSIGSSAFYGCTGLTSVTIPNSVISIADKAFYNCTGMTSVHITDLTKWCEIEFVNDYSNPLRYAKHLYLNGSEVTDLVIPEGVESVGNYAFYNCSSLTSVTIPESVTSIGSSTFYGCIGLTSVTIPDGVISIGNNAFYNVPNIVYHGSATGSPWGAKSVNGYIDGYFVFEDSEKTRLLTCFTTAVGEISIPNSVISILDNAFYNCTGITSVTIPESVMSLGSYAFYGCSGLNSVHITDLAKWCKIQFTNGSSNPFYYAKHLYLNGSEVTDLAIPNGVDSIGDYAFMYCNNLTSVNIPESVSFIGGDAFYGCSGLNSVYITDLAKWCKIEFANGYANPLRSAKHLNINGSELTELVIPDGIDTIGKSAFFSHTGFSSVILPKGITMIQDSAFYCCTALGNVYCKAMTPPSIGQRTFGVSAGTDGMGFASNGILFVPYDAIESYRAENAFVNAFTEIKGFSDVVEISETSAQIIWLPDQEVTQYSIDVCHDGVSIARYAVDGDGNIISSQRFAPSIYKQKLDTTQSSTEYFVVFVDDLEPGTEYTYSIEGTNNQQQKIYHEAGVFTTLDDPIEEIEGFSDVLAITEHSATIIWQPYPEVVRYTISVYLSSTSVARYVVDGDGNIISSPHLSPNLYMHLIDTAQRSTECFEVDIEGLMLGTNYTYTIKGINNKQQKIYHSEGVFSTLDKPIEEIEGFSDVVDVTESSAMLIWQPNQDVTQFTIDVFQSETLVAQYVTDNFGIVVSSKQFVSSLHLPKMDATQNVIDYLKLAIGGLAAETTYAYTIKGINNRRQSIYRSAGAFTTRDNPIEDIEGFSLVGVITDTSAKIIWLPNPEVVQYTVNVKQAETPILQYLVDSEGAVVSSKHYAPSVYTHEMDTTQGTTKYYFVSLDDLKPGTEYTYSIEGTNNQQQNIYHSEGAFTTISIKETIKTYKILRDGQLFIIREDYVYDTQGRLIMRLDDTLESFDYWSERNAKNR